MLQHLALIACLLCATSFAHTARLSKEEYAVLDIFFRVLIEESEVGYVLEGKKPMCVHGFFHKDPFSVNTLPHKHSVALREGARVWKKLTALDTEVCLTVADREDPLIPNWVHVITIHRPLFTKILNDNLPLFQYILGPTINPESALQAITSDQTTYHSFLKGDKVLVGEILGFGAQNSLYISRIENIEEAYSEVEPPFISAQKTKREYPTEYLPFEPGFGFNSVQKELDFLQKQVTFSSEKLMHSSPEFVFGRLRESQESDKLVAVLEDTQLKIKSRMHSRRFIEEILEVLTGLHYTRPASQKHFLFCLDKNTLNIAVAKGIWEFLQQYDNEYIPHFIEGLNEDKVDKILVDHAAYHPSFRRELTEAINNLKAANMEFSALEDDEDFICISPGELYYRTLEAGRGEIKCQGALVSLDFSIFAPSGHCLQRASHMTVNLKNTIRGFSQGVKGMRAGETREIRIHPSLAYGFETSLNQCISLRAVVTLHNIHDNEPYSQNGHAIDLENILTPASLQKRNDEYRSALRLRGQELAKHLTQCVDIDLDRVRKYLMNLYNNDKQFIPTSEHEQALINRMHWNIYFGTTKYNNRLDN